MEKIRSVNCSVLHPQHQQGDATTQQAGKNVRCIVFRLAEMHQAGGVRARGLGPLSLPAWGSLDARVDFTVPVEALGLGS
eukprot:s313_g18.t2